MFGFGKKRQKSDNSEDSSPEKTPAKKKVFIEGPHSCQGNIVNNNIGEAHSSNYQPQMENLDGGNFDISHIQFDKDAPLYAQQIWSQLKVLSTNMSSLVTSYQMLEQKVTVSQDIAKSANDRVEKCESVIQELMTENKKLREAQVSAEAYSKKYNLIVHNIPETPGETSQILRDKIGKILWSVGLDTRPMYIDNIHRLPASNKDSIKPIIIKFVSYLDREYIWSKRDRLTGHPSKIIIREHFPKEIESNLRQLLPIRRAAINQGITVKMSGDKLTMRGKSYTVKNLHTLPENLRPENVTTRKTNDFLFFFNGACPLSNFHSSKFTVDGRSYSCAEQWLQEQKAVHFRDFSTAKQIMEAETPQKMKALGRTCSNFVDKTWKEVSPEILNKGLMEKFTQNPHLKIYLLGTGSLELVEAAKNDRWFGIGRHLWQDDIESSKETWGHNLQGKTLKAVRQRLVELDRLEEST